MARLNIGVDVAGAEKVAKLAENLQNLSKASADTARSTQEGNAAYGQLALQLEKLSQQAKQVGPQLQQINTMYRLAAGGVREFMKELQQNKDLSSQKFLNDAIATTQAYRDLGVAAREARIAMSGAITGNSELAVAANNAAEATYAVSASTRAQVAALNQLQALDAKYVATLGMQILLEDQGAIALREKTAAIQAQIAAYGKLTAMGVAPVIGRGNYTGQLAEAERMVALSKQYEEYQQKAASYYSAGRNKLGLGAEQATDNKMAEQALTNLKNIEQAEKQLADLRSAQGKISGGDNAARLRAESLLYDELTGKLKVNIEQMAIYDQKSGKLVNGVEVAAALSAAYDKVGASLGKVTSQAAAADIALDKLQGTKAPTSAYAATGRNALKSGASGGGAYAAQIAAESKMYDEVTGKLKTHIEDFAKYDKESKKLLNGKQMFAEYERAFAQASGTSKDFFTRMTEGIPVLGHLGKEFDNLGAKGTMLHDTMRGVSGAMGGLWMTYGNMVPLIAGFAVAATTLKAIKIDTEFDYLTRYTQALSDGAIKGADGLKQLQTQLLAVKDISQGPNELAAGMLEFARAGTDTNVALQHIGELSRFATLGEMDLAKAIELVVGQTRAFKDVNFSEAVNIVAKVADDTSVSITQMVEAFKNTTELGTVMHAKFADVATAIGVMADHGIRGATAGAALRTSLLQLIAPSGSAIKIMGDLGVSFSAIDKGTGKIKNLKQMMIDLYEATKHLGEGEKTVVLEKMTGNRSIKAIGSLLDAVKEEMNILSKGDSAVEKHGKTWDDTAKAVAAAIDKMGGGHTYLQETMESMAESGHVQLERLKADFERLLVAAVNSEDITKSLKDLRDIVADPAVQSGIQHMVNLFIKLASLSFGNLAALGNFLQMTRAMFSGDVEIPQWLKMLTSGSNKDVGNWAEMYNAGTSELNASLEEKQDKLEELQKKLAKGQSLGYPETSPYMTQLKDQVDSTQTALTNVMAIYDKTQVSLGKQDALKHMAQSLLNVGKSGEIGAEGIEKTTAAAEIFRMQQAANLESAGAVAKVKAKMQEQVDEFSAQIINPGSNKYEAPKQGESDEQYLKRVTQLTKEYAVQVERLNSVELERAKKQDIAFTADQILAKRGEAQARMENNEAIRQTVAEMNNYVLAMKIASAEDEHWLKFAEKSYKAMEKLSDQYALLGKSDIEKSQIRESIALEKATKEAEAYQLALREVGNEVTKLMSRYDSLAGARTQTFAELKAEGFTDEQAESKLAAAEKTRRVIAEQARKAIGLKYKLEDPDEQRPTPEQFAAGQKLENLVQANKKAYGAIGAYTSGIYNQMMSDAGIEYQYYLDTTNDKELAYKMYTENVRRIQESMPNESWSTAIGYGLDDVAEKAKYVGRDISRAFEDAFDKAGDAIADFVMTGKGDFKDLIESLISDLARLMVRQNITGPLAGMLSGMLFGTGTADYAGAASDITNLIGTSGLFHTGGVVGTGEGGRRGGVDPSIFTNAPRFHQGLMPDEFPSILKKGEGVFTPQQMRALGGITNNRSTHTSVNVPVNVEGGGSKRMTIELKREVEHTVTEVIRRHS